MPTIEEIGEGDPNRSNAKFLVGASVKILSHYGIIKVKGRNSKGNVVTFCFQSCLVRCEHDIRKNGNKGKLVFQRGTKLKFDKVRIS